MSQPRPLSVALFVALAAGTAAQAQVNGKGSWQVLAQVPPSVAAGEAWIRPSVFTPLALDTAALRRELARAPMEVGFRAPAQPLVMSLPMPDGTFARFNVWESPIMEAPLQAEFPEVRTYAGQGIDDPAAVVRFDLTPLGFHSQILSPSGAVYVDPYTRGDTHVYTSYYKRDYSRKADGWQCLVPEGERLPRLGAPGGAADSASGGTFRTYRLANAATGEYTAFFGGTVAGGQAAIVTAINRVTGVYELDQSIRLILVANNSSIVYTNATTDPYTNNNPSSLLTQNQTTCDSVIGTANYDIGHVFSTGGGGLATLSCVGVAGQKARAETGLPSPTGDPFYIDYVAHEMGHQFGANHTFNSSTGSCAGNRSATHAYEPGSGSTIMGYAGICGTDDLQAHSDPYMLADSHDAITSYTSAGAGAGNTQTATGNTLPTVNAGLDYTIPTGTPFLLTATASDPDPGQTLTYCWEERDLGASTTLGTQNGTAPIIRSLNPVTVGTRMIPPLANVLANSVNTSQLLPNTARVMNFRCCVRDNRANGGGYNDDNMVLTIVNTGASFAVTAPNTAVSWGGGSSQTVTWNVAGTTANGINCANVAILLSTDGGATFPTTILSSTPNDGSEVITVPNSATTQARIKVQAVGNIFFDICNTNFTITAAPPPGNNACASATVVGVGSTAFSTVNATTDGPAEAGCSFCCSDPQVNQDVWFRFTAPCTGTVTASLCGATFDTKIAIYAGLCPAGPSAIACNDDSNSCALNSLQSYVTFPSTSGSVYTIRVGGFGTFTGTGNLVLSCDAAPTCYANCDGSTGSPNLTSNDFQCFLNRFAAGDTYANCDGSTGSPTLTSNDFQCFLNTFAAGCT